MSGMNEMKPAGADGMRMKKKFDSNNKVKVKARPWWLHAIRPKGAGATRILVVSSMPKTKAELASKGDPSLFAR